jgi:predicted dehydrogenase
VPAGSTAETYYTALVRCENGTVISLERGEYVAAQPEIAYEIVGENGSVRFEMTALGTDTIEVVELSTTDGASKATARGVGDVDFDVHSGPTIDFARSILDKRKPKTGLEDALIVQRITDGIYESARAGCSVDL